MAEQLQHYVPRFLLRRFGHDRELLYVMDKHTGRQFQISTSRRSSVEIAAERGMYDFEFMGTPMTLEPALAALEAGAASMIERIVRDRTLDHSRPQERATLAGFLAVQMVRTRAAWTTHQDFFERMGAWLRREGAPDDFFEPDPLVGGGENAQRALRAKIMCNAPADFGRAIAEKDWVLLETEGAGPYLMGDHPLTLFNQIDRWPRGNLGVKVKGIELYFPLSPTLALAMWCPSIQKQLVDGFKRLDQLSEHAPHIAIHFREAWEDGIRAVEAMRSGKALPNRPDSVTHFNSLQISTAERFVFSCDGDFALVEEMIRDNPELRFGRRLEEATGKF
ncbi:MAG TPA: DUF4238 domain-containing protein [Burkholderiales bacterium]|nr:DUF4238 domain-containing protein [Burkholderiales bacterium]